MARLLAPHGDRRRYLQGCGCRPCRKANTDYMAEYRARKAAEAKKGARRG